MSSGKNVTACAAPATIAASVSDILPLTGADCFLRAFEAEVGRTGGASHVSQLVLRVGSGFDFAAFARLIEEVSRANPILRAPIRRHRRVGAPVYRLDLAARAPAIEVELHAQTAAQTHTTADVLASRRETLHGAVPSFDAAPSSRVAPSSHAAPTLGAAPPPGATPPLGAMPGLFSRRLNERLDARRGRLLRFDVVPRGGAHPGSDIAMTWIHMLFDGSGSELFVEHLAACAADPNRPRAIAIARAPGGASSPAVAELPAASGARGRMAQAWNAYMQGLAAKPPTSLAGPLRRVRQDLVYDEMRFEGADAENAIARAKKTAGFLTPMLFYLAVAMRAHQSVADQRKNSPASWIVPLPVNLRPKGSEGEVFRTHVSLLWFQVTPDETRDLARLVELLKAQRLAAIRAKLVEAGVAAMDFARYAPARVYSHMARRTFGGELASFFFAYTADFAPAAESLCGADILDGFHVPSVPASPGSALVFCLPGGGLDVVHVHQRGVLTPAELAVFRGSIRDDLLAQPPQHEDIAKGSGQA